MAEPAILLVTDDRERSGDVPVLLSDVARLKTVDLGAPVDLREGNWKAVLFDADLGSIDSVRKVRMALTDASRKTVPRIFLVRKDSHHARVQAAAFGCKTVLGRPLNPKRLREAIFGPPPEPEPAPIPAEILAASKLTEELTAASFDAIRFDKSLNLRKIAEGGEQIDAALAGGTVEDWVSAVRNHHSHTYRHCMLVSGVVASFARSLGMGGPSRQRLIRGALLHDIGKAKIPVAVLDKPTALSVAERALMREHPIYGRDFLIKHHGKESELIQIVHLHHEMLDGTGYPLGLNATAITDAVRITTICDIYSALIEPRPYKRAYSGEEAYDAMKGMGAKLDPDLMRVFEPFALQQSGQGSFLG